MRRQPRAWQRSLALFCFSGLLFAECPTTEQSSFWIGRKFEGNKVIVFLNVFDLSKEHPAGRKLDLPPNSDWEDVESFSPDTMDRLNRLDPQALHFSLGEQFDIWAERWISTMTVDSLIGVHVGAGGGDLYETGVLGHVNGLAGSLPGKYYYVVARHSERQQRGATNHSPELQPVQLSPTVQSEIKAALIGRMHETASAVVRRQASKTSPTLAIQPFSLGDGSLRYYASANWIDSSQKIVYALGAWLSLRASRRILATEQPNPGEPDFGDPTTLPALLTFFSDLRDGRTGVLVGADLGYPIRLLIYRDGLTTGKLTCLAELAALAD